MRLSTVNNVSILLSNGLSIRIVEHNSISTLISIETSVNLSTDTSLSTTLTTKVDKVLNKSVILDSEINKLSSYPTLDGIITHYVRGDGGLGEIVVGSGGGASNVYSTNIISPLLSTAFKSSFTNDTGVTYKNITLSTTNETLGQTYLFESPVNLTTINAGVWKFHYYAKVDVVQGTTSMRIEHF